MSERCAVLCWKRGLFRHAMLLFVPLLAAGCMTLGDRPAPPPPSEAPALAPSPPPEVVVQDVPPPTVPSRRKAPERKVQTDAKSQAKPALRTARSKAQMDPRKLIGMEPLAVERLLGAPALVRNDRLSRELVYAAPGCSFRVIFYPNLNAASFRALKYVGRGADGEMLGESDNCIQGILTARK